MANILRENIIDGGYDLIRDWLFKYTKEDPEIAHENFIELSQLICESNLEELLLNNSANKIELPFEFSNAAGFNKNGNISPQFLKYLGFNRVEIGTVTNDAWDGNLRPRIKRFFKTNSIVNWMGLPGVGSKKVAENIEYFGEVEIPISINLMATPILKDGKMASKEGDDLLRDLEGTIIDTCRLCDRYVLNISCPNTHSTDGKCDARSKYQLQLSDMLKVMINYASDKELFVKVSPDLTVEGVFEILDVIQDYSKIMGIVGTNTTTQHDPNYITEKLGKGGASGHAVRHLSRMIQEYFITEIRNRKLPLKYISVGGIDSVEEVGERLELGADGIQIFTGLIYEGPKLIREIRDSVFLRSYK